MAKKQQKQGRMTLLEKTIDLMRHRDRTLTLDMLADECDCTKAFLSTLMSPNPPRRPGVNAIQRLYEKLSGSPLEY